MQLILVQDMYNTYKLLTTNVAVTIVVKGVEGGYKRHFDTREVTLAT